MLHNFDKPGVLEVRNRQTVNVGGSNNQDDTPKAKIKVTQSGYMNSQTLTIGQQPGR